MTPRERAEKIVKWFQEEGHPFYDELLGPIANAIQQAVWDERGACAAIASRTAEAWRRERGAGSAKYHTARAIDDQIRSRRDYSDKDGDA